MLSQVMTDTEPELDPSDSATPEAEAPQGDPTSAGPRSATSGGAAGWAALAAVVVVLIGVVAISLAGGSSTASSAAKACAPSVDEPLDPNSVVRVLPNARELEYLNDPPTSGAFIVGPQVPPVSPTALTRPVQVGLLARGDVLLQYQPTLLDPADVTQLEALAGDAVVVAPNPSLKAAISATAWRKRQVCTALDTDAVRKFATVNANRAPADLTTPTTGN